MKIFIRVISSVFILGVIFVCLLLFKSYNEKQVIIPQLTIVEQQLCQENKKTNESDNQKLDEMLNQLNYDDEIITRINRASKFLDLLKNKSESNYSARYLFNLKLRIRSEQEFETVLNRYENTLNEEKEISCYLLATNSLILGKPDISLDYFKRLQNEYPNSIFLKWMLDKKEDIDFLKKAAKCTREIEALNLAEDEKLWKLGVLFSEVLNVTWNEGEGSFSDLTYPHKLYQKLIKQYPESKWADNAKWELIDYAELWVHEDGVYGLDCVSNLEDFIKQYPDSDCIPKAKLQIAIHYFSVAIDSENPDYKLNKEYLKKAEEQFKEITKKYIKSEYEEHAKEYLERIQNIWEENK